MSSVTLAESAKLAQDELVAGVIENIITVNRMFDVLPFDSIEGNSLAYNRENALGDVITATVGTTYSGAAAGKAPATFTKVNSNLTTIMGDAEVNGLIQATRSGDGNDQTGVQIASKAKSAGRKYQDMMINGDGTGTTFAGLTTLCDAGQIIASTGANGDAFTFETLDALLSLVVDKDGVVDYIACNVRTINQYRSKLRALGGANITEVVELPSGEEVPAYGGVPMFRNDYISVGQTRGTATNATTIFAGTFDDGSRTHGITGLTATQASGIQVVDVGEKEDADEHIWRVKWYCGLALFSSKGLAMATGIIPG